MCARQLARSHCLWRPWKATLNVALQLACAQLLGLQHEVTPIVSFHFILDSFSINPSPNWQCIQQCLKGLIWLFFPGPGSEVPFLLLFVSIQFSSLFSLYIHRREEGCPCEHSDLLQRSSLEYAWRKRGPFFTPLCMHTRHV